MTECKSIEWLIHWSSTIEEHAYTSFCAWVSAQLMVINFSCKLLARHSRSAFRWIRVDCTKEDDAVWLPGWLSKHTDLDLAMRQELTDTLGLHRWWTGGSGTLAIKSRSCQKSGRNFDVSVTQSRHLNYLGTGPKFLTNFVTEFLTTEHGKLCWGSAKRPQRLGSENRLRGKKHPQQKSRRP